MQEHDANSNPDRLERAPAPLVRALKSVFAERPFVPQSTDEAILRTARERLAPRPHPRHSWNLVFRWAAGISAAAACVWIVTSLTQPMHLARGDINRDGKVDILDALALSRAIQTGARLPLEADLNDDGKIDDADVALICARAVRLAQNTGEHGTRTGQVQSLEPQAIRYSMLQSKPSFLVVTRSSCQ